jgi:hypothetical protein
MKLRRERGHAAVGGTGNGLSIRLGQTGFTMPLTLRVLRLYGFIAGPNSGMEPHVRVTLPPYFTRTQPFE